MSILPSTELLVLAWPTDFNAPCMSLWCPARAYGDLCNAIQVGATLNILARCEHDAAPAEVAALQHGLDAAAAAKFVLSCQKETGGFGKWGPGQGAADPLHTFFSLAGLQLMYDQHARQPHFVPLLPLPS